jgi:phage shock protein E
VAGNIRKNFFDLTSNFDSEIYLYCRSGNRSGKAKKILDDIGFTNVINAGGKEEASIMIDRIMQNVND